MRNENESEEEDDGQQHSANSREENPVEGTMDAFLTTTDANDSMDVNDTTGLDDLQAGTRFCSVKGCKAVIPSAYMRSAGLRVSLKFFS